jgi:hypothetical protein
MPFILFSVLFLYYYTIEKPVSLGLGHTSFIGMLLLFIIVISAIAYPFLIFETLSIYKELIQSNPARNNVLVIIIFQFFHAVSIFSYDIWSNSAARVLVCFMGLSLFIFAGIKVFFLKREVPKPNA